MRPDKRTSGRSGGAAIEKGGAAVGLQQRQAPLSQRAFGRRCAARPNFTRSTLCGAGREEAQASALRRNAKTCSPNRRHPAKPRSKFRNQRRLELEYNPRCDRFSTLRYGTAPWADEPSVHRDGHIVGESDAMLGWGPRYGSSNHASAPPLHCRLFRPRASDTRRLARLRQLNILARLDTTLRPHASPAC